MNIKQLLFGRFQKTVTTTAMTPVQGSTESLPVQNSLDAFLVSAIIASIIFAFIAGFLCWGCLVLWKKRNRNRLSNNHFELEDLNILDSTDQRESDSSNIASRNHFHPETSHVFESPEPVTSHVLESPEPQTSHVFESPEPETSHVLDSTENISSDTPSTNPFALIVNQHSILNGNNSCNSNDNINTQTITMHNPILPRKSSRTKIPTRLYVA